MIRGVLFDFGETLVEEVSDATAPLSQLPLVPFADAVQTLAELDRAGLELGVISNTTQTDAQELRRALEHLGMATYFGTIVTSFDVGHEKPDPAIFRIALEGMRCAPEEAVMVGDDPERDIAGAGAAGIATILVRRRERPMPPCAVPTFVVESLTELPDLVIRTLTRPSRRH